MTERFQPLSRYHLVHVFKSWGVLFLWWRNHQVHWIVSSVRRFHAFYVYFVKDNYFYFSWKIPNCCTIRRSTLLSLKTCYKAKPFFSIFGWRFMLKSIRDSKYCLRDHVNYHSNFCFEINWINNFKLKILICLFLKHCMKHQVLMFFPCFLRKVKEINSSDVNCVS